MLGFTSLNGPGDGVNPSACIKGTPEFDADVCAAFNAVPIASTTGFVHESGNTFENVNGNTVQTTTGVPDAPPIECPAGSTLFSMPFGPDACVPDGPAAAAAVAQGAVAVSKSSTWMWMVGFIAAAGLGYAGWRRWKR